MASNVKTAKRRGPLPSGKGMLVGVRLQPNELKALDHWIRDYGKPQTRPEAIRQLVRSALAMTKIARKLSSQRSPYGLELAAAKISSVLYPREFADLKFELLTKKQPE
jgi:hypothetical protein